MPMYSMLPKQTVFLLLLSIPESTEKLPAAPVWEKRRFHASWEAIRTGNRAIHFMLSWRSYGVWSTHAVTGRRGGQWTGQQSQDIGAESLGDGAHCRARRQVRRQTPTEDFLARSLA